MSPPSPPISSDTCLTHVTTAADFSLKRRGGLAKLTFQLPQRGSRRTGKTPHATLMRFTTSYKNHIHTVKLE